jgi:iron complex transport system permease protein
VARVLLDRDSSEAATIVWAVRMPRTLLLVGLALGAAGALMQAHTRNPLYSRGARWTRGR